MSTVERAKEGREGGEDRITIMMTTGNYRYIKQFCTTQYS